MKTSGSSVLDHFEVGLYKMIKIPCIHILSFLIGTLLLLYFIEGNGAAEHYRASTPPRGWNSYDSFSWIITEKQFLDNAKVVANKLLEHGYEYVVVDYLWYRRIEPGSSASSPGYDIIDEWGRLVPDPSRWPSSKGGKGFKPIADLVHKMGLKFGIHVMRGISAQAVNANTPILGPNGAPYVEGGRTWHAKEIGLVNQSCAWMPQCFMSVDTTLGAGRAFLKSLYEQYAQWGVDFVKHDCVFGDNLDLNEITTVSEILQDIGRPIVYSLSPGSHATPAMAKKISSRVNMYRVTDDDWDNFNDLYLHFNVSRDFASAGLIGAKGLLGKSWPDLDMLPIGWITDPSVKQGPHRFSNLTLNEQKTQMTLWAMAKSPYMYGGDLRKIDPTTLSIITNPVLLAINSYSYENREIREIYFSSEISSKTKIKKDFNISLSATGCTKTSSQIFGMNEMNQICWKGYSSKNGASQLCFDKRKTRENQGQYQVLASSTTNICLDSSPNYLLKIGKFQTHNFASCNEYKSQEWELKNGFLYNNYSGLCASLAFLKDESSINEMRIWSAKIQWASQKTTTNRQPRPMNTDEYLDADEDGGLPSRTWTYRDEDESPWTMHKRGSAEVVARQIGANVGRADTMSDGRVGVDIHWIWILAAHSAIAPVTTLWNRRGSSIRTGADVDMEV